MLDVNNSKLLADVILAGLVIFVLVTVLKNRHAASPSPLILSAMAFICLVVQLTVDIALSVDAISGSEQNLVALISNWRALLVSLISGLLVFSLLLLVLQHSKALDGLPKKSIATSVNQRRTDTHPAIDSNLQQLAAIRASQRQRALGSLIGHVTHQLQNRTAVMLSHAELAKSNLETDSALHENLTGIHRSLLISSQLVHHVAAFSNSGQRALAPVDVVKALQRVTPLLTEIMPATTAFNVTFSESPLMVLGDGADLQLALVCLISDALEALKNSRGEITVSVQEAATRGAVIIVQISGFSLHADTELNAEANLEAGQSSPATGAGFPTVEQVTARHGGDIDVTSSQDSGTTISLYFPRAS